MACEVIFVKVKSRSSNVGINSDEEGNFVVSVRSPRDKGKANAEMIKLLAEHYAVPKTNISIISGFNSSQKKVRIDSYE